MVILELEENKPEAARQRIECQFSMAAMAEAYLRVYKGSRLS